jgi:hypothetical protein
MSSCFSRCLRVPIAIRAFYESYLWILQTLLLTHPDLHPGLLGHCALPSNRPAAAHKDAARMTSGLDIYGLRFEALKGQTAWGGK